MSVEIKKISTKKEIVKFITFPEKLFKGDPMYIPALLSDEKNNLYKDRNPAMDFCEADYFMAYRDSKPVGRVAAIINHNANADWNEKVVRFGWIDFIDDVEVAGALLKTVEEWGRERGCTAIKGPLGFSDMDKEGMMVDGFDRIQSITVIYNPPYYPQILEKLGYTKAADWTQKIVHLPESIPEILKLGDRIEQKFALEYVTLKSKKEMTYYGRKMFDTLNEAFGELFEFTKLSQRQKEVYTKQYVSILNPKLVSIVKAPDGEVAAFMIGLPSLSRAMQKARGRMFPFGWYHLLKAMNKNSEMDGLMVGAIPKYQGTGAAVVMMRHAYDNMYKFGIRTLYMNPQLETNIKVQTAFDCLEPQEYTRRRCYIKNL